MSIDISKLLLKINKLGYSMTNSNDIMRIGKNDKVLIPILIKRLQETSNIVEKDLIVRALGVKGYSEASDALLDEFEDSDHMLYKWAIGNSISIIQDKSTKDRLVKIISDNKHGTARQMMIVALGKMKIEEAIPTLINLLEDNQEVGHVICALGYYEKPELMKYFKAYLNHDKTWVRNEAKKAIKKIEKLQQRKK